MRIYSFDELDWVDEAVVPRVFSDKVAPEQGWDAALLMSSSGLDRS